MSKHTKFQVNRPSISKVIRELLSSSSSRNRSFIGSPASYGCQASKIRLKCGPHSAVRPFMYPESAKNGTWIRPPGPENPDFLRVDPADPDKILQGKTRGQRVPTYQILGQSTKYFKSYNQNTEQQQQKRIVHRKPCILRMPGFNKKPGRSELTVDMKTFQPPRPNASTPSLKFFDQKFCLR